MNTAVVSYSEARVLSALWSTPDRAVTVREISQRAGVSDPTVRAYVKGLTWAGLIARVCDRPAAWRITGRGHRALIARGGPVFPIDRQPGLGE